MSTHTDISQIAEGTSTTADPTSLSVGRLPNPLTHLISILPFPGRSIANPSPIRCQFIRSCAATLQCQSDANSYPIFNLVSIQCQSIPIQCQSRDDPAPIRCQFGTELMPIQSQSSANPRPIKCQLIPIQM